MVLPYREYITPQLFSSGLINYFEDDSEDEGESSVSEEDGEGSEEKSEGEAGQWG
jgi:hypothetical protein